MKTEPQPGRARALLETADPALYAVETAADGPEGELPLSETMLREWPSGDLFGLSQNVGMGWNPARAADASYLILSTQGGLRGGDGKPVALGYHTGHWEVGLLVEEAARTFTAAAATPFAAMVSDPCDGRTQGTLGMMDSLPYRNDAAMVFGRLIRSLPTRSGVLGVATCDKGLPAMMMALANARGLPCVLVPGGVTLPPRRGEDAGKIQSIGARYSHGELTLAEAAELGCRACASPGGGCQFLGTAATAQVVAEALGLALPHAALAPSGQPIWKDVAHRSALALLEHTKAGISVDSILTPAAIRNAMHVHAAFGGSTNLLIHLPAVAHAAGLPRPTVDDWHKVNVSTPRLVSVLPNGPDYHPTIRVYLAGGVPEVMLHLRALGLLDLSVLTAAGIPLGDALDWWETSERRKRLRARLWEQDTVDPDAVIMAPAIARERGLTSTVTFPRGNLAPGGAVIKSTAIDPSVVDPDGVYRKSGPARVFTREKEAIAAIKGQSQHPIQPGDVLVLMGRGPSGAGMEEIYQITAALKHLSWGKQVAVLTDARFSGVSTGACVGHVSPEALTGGPFGKLREGDTVRIVIDRVNLTGSIDLVAAEGKALDKASAERLLASRTPNPLLSPDPDLPDATRLWAALQAESGGVWGGCVFDTDAILKRLANR